MAIVYRSVKGSNLTPTEVDTNFSTLAARLPAPKNTLAIYGTSIESLVIDGNGDYDARSAIVHANSMLGWPWSTLYDHGVSSDTSAQMLARLADVIADAPGYCYVGFPINDVNGAAVAYATTITNMTAIYDGLLAAGIVVFAATGGPTSTFSDTGTGSTREAYARVIAAIKNYAAGKAGFVVINTALAMTDPATGEPFTSPATTIDGIHDSYEGAMRKGRAIADVCATIVKSQDTITEFPYDPLNYAVNPFCLGDNASGTNGYTAGTGVSGTGPNGWSASRRNTGTSVGSRITRSTSYGRQPATAPRYAFSAVANYDAAIVTIGGDDTLGTGRYDQNWAATTAYTYGIRRKKAVSNGMHYVCVVPGTSGAVEPSSTQEGAFVVDGTVTWMVQKTPEIGDVFYGEAEVELSGLTAGKGCGVSLQIANFNTSGALVNSRYCLKYDISGTVGVPARYVAPVLRLRTPPMTVSVAATSLRYMWAKVSIYGENGASCNIDICRVGIIRVV